MDPETLSTMSLGGGLLKGIGQLLQGFMGSSMDLLQKSIAQSNVTLLQQKAGIEADEGKLALAQGGLEQSRVSNTIGRTIGAETGKFAASNLDPTYGSPLLLEGFSAGQGATDLALVGAKAELGNASDLAASAGTLGQAAGEQGQAVAFGSKATQDIIAGITGAAATALSAGSNSNMWANLNASANAIGSGGKGGGGFDFPGITVGGNAAVY
jgi:hypothetical protein